AMVTLQTNALDAAVVDLHLPDIRGTEVLAALKAQNVPAVAISGVFRGPIFETKIKTEFGAQALVEKPFDLRALVAQVESLLPGAPPFQVGPAKEIPELALAEEVDVDPASDLGADDAARLMAAE